MAIGFGSSDDIGIKVKADLENYEKNLKKAEAMAKDFKGKIGKISGAMKTVGKVGTIGFGLAAAGIGMAVKKGIEFERQMKNVQSVAGATSEEFEQLSDFAKKMGEQTVFSASESAEAMYFLASAGFETGQIMGALSGVMDLAAATQADLGEASEIVVSTINAFGLEAEDAGRVANVFAAGISASQLTMSRLGVAMPYLSSLMNTFGMTVEDTVAVLGVLSNAGIKASTAGAMMSSSMAKLLDLTPKAKDALETYGLTAEDVNPTIHNIADIVKTLGEAQVETTDIVRIFGAESSRVWLTLLEQGHEALTTMTEDVTGTQKATEMANIQLDSMDGLIRLIKSAIEGIQLAIFDELKDDLKGAGESFKDFMPILKDFSVTFVQDLIPAVQTLAGYVGDLMESFNDLTPSQQEAIVKGGALAAALFVLSGPVLLLAGMFLPMLTTALLASSVAGGTAAFGVGTLTAAVWSLYLALFPVVAVFAAFWIMWKAGQSIIESVTGETMSFIDAVKEAWKGVQMVGLQLSALKKGEIMYASEAKAIIELGDEYDRLAIAKEKANKKVAVQTERVENDEMRAMLEERARLFGDLNEDAGEFKQIIDEAGNVSWAPMETSLAGVKSEAQLINDQMAILKAQIEQLNGTPLRLNLELDTTALSDFGG